MAETVGPNHIRVFRSDIEDSVVLTQPDGTCIVNIGPVTLEAADREVMRLLVAEVFIRIPRGRIREPEDTRQPTASEMAEMRKHVS